MIEILFPVNGEICGEWFIRRHGRTIAYAVFANQMGLADSPAHITIHAARRSTASFGPAGQRGSCGLPQQLTLIWVKARQAFRRE